MADRRLQVFQAVARHLSFTKAAETLRMTQPAVTFQIKQLEEQFNTRLFERGHGQGSRIHLTPAGELVVQYADRILELNAELQQQMHELAAEISGPLIIGASTTIAEFILPRLLGEFKSHHPQVQPQLVVANSETLITQVSEHLLDLAIIETRVERNQIEATACGEDELMVICHPDFPLAHHRLLQPRQLLEQPFVCRELGSGTRLCTAEYLEAAGLSLEALDIIMEMGSPIAINGVLETGLGFAIASRTSAAKAVRLGLLTAIPLMPRLRRPLHFIRPKDRFQSRLQNAFIEFASPRIRQYLLDHQSLTDHPVPACPT